MKYEVFGGNLPAVTMYPEVGESVFAQTGGMSWMSAEIDMSTNMEGGLKGGIGRLFSGESLFQVTYTATRQDQYITFGSSFPGNIVVLDVAKGPYICQKSAFLCAEMSVDLGAYVVEMKGLKGFATGLFGGEGFVLQEYAGTGFAFLEIDGSVREIDLAPGEKLKIDTGSVAAFEKTCKYSIDTVKGFKNIIFGGEGLFLTTLEGPGKVWLQTMSMPRFASKIAPFLPFKSKD